MSSKPEIWPQNWVLQNNFPYNYKQKQTLQAYPDSLFAAILPAKPPGDPLERDKVAATQAENEVILDIAVNKRTKSMKRIFTNAMPNFINRNLLDQSEAATSQGFRVARR